MLDADTFSDPNVIQYAKENLFSLKIDVDTEDGTELFSTFNGTVMPTILFLDSNLNEIDRIIGYLPPMEYQNKLKDIMNNIYTIEFYLNKYNNDERTAELIYELAQKYVDRNEFDLAKKYYLELLDTFPDINQKMLSNVHFQLAYDAFKNGDIEPFDKFIEEFSNNTDLVQKALWMMIRFYKSEDNNVSELGVFKRMLDLYPNDPRVLNGYAWRMSELKLNLQDALIKVRHAVKLVDEDKNLKAGILDTEAEVLWRMGHVNDAILTIEKSIIIDPSNKYFIDQKRKFVNSKKNVKDHVST